MSQEPTSKQKQREMLAAEIAAFIQRGGAIQKIPQGVMGQPYDAAAHQSPASHRRAEYKKQAIAKLLACETAAAFIKTASKLAVQSTTVVYWRQYHLQLAEHIRALGISVIAGKFTIRKQK